MNNTFEPSVFLAFIGFHGTIYCFSTISFWSEIDWPERKPWFMENLTIYLLFPFPFDQRYNDLKENLGTYDTSTSSKMTNKFGWKM